MRDRKTMPLNLILMSSSFFIPVALVDPGHITIPLCDDPEVVGRGAEYGR